MILAKINVSKILKEHLFQGKNGKYLDLVIWENKSGKDQYGNTHIVCQSVSKEAREKGVKGPIIGNMKMESRNPAAPAAPADSEAWSVPPGADDDVPL